MEIEQLKLILEALQGVGNTAGLVAITYMVLTNIKAPLVTGIIGLTIYKTIKMTVELANSKKRKK